MYIRAYQLAQNSLSCTSFVHVFFPFRRPVPYISNHFEAHPHEWKAEYL